MSALNEHTNHHHHQHISNVKVSRPPSLVEDSFGWSDFPLVGHLSVTVPPPEAASPTPLSCGSITRTFDFDLGESDFLDNPTDELRTLSIEPSPILCSNSFHWGDFPLLQSSSVEGQEFLPWGKRPRSSSSMDRTVTTFGTDLDEDESLPAGDMEEQEGQWMQASLADFTHNSQRFVL